MSLSYRFGTFKIWNLDDEVRDGWATSYDVTFVSTSHFGSSESYNYQHLFLPQEIVLLLFILCLWKKNKGKRAAAKEGAASSLTSPSAIEQSPRKPATGSIHCHQNYRLRRLPAPHPEFMSESCQNPPEAHGSSETFVIMTVRSGIFQTATRPSGLILNESARASQTEEILIQIKDYDIDI